MVECSLKTDALWGLLCSDLQRALFGRRCRRQRSTRRSFLGRGRGFGQHRWFSMSSSKSSSNSNNNYNWPNLQADLLAEILIRLEIADFIRFTAVCRSWRSVPQSIPRCRPKDTQWLLILTTFPNFSSYPLTSLLASSPPLNLNNSLHYNFHLPQSQIHSGSHFIGSSQGFLITLNESPSSFSFTLSAFNPLTRTHLPLPPQLPFPTPPYIALINVHKLVISPSLHKVVLLLQLLEQQAGVRNVTMVLLWAQPGEASWTHLPNPANIHTFQDFIFHKGRLHCIDKTGGGSLVVFDLDNASQPCTITPLRINQSLASANFLALSAVGDELLLLAVSPTGGGMGTRFNVFRLDETDFHWDETRDLGEAALFCGRNCLFSLSTSEFPSLKRNNIYFYFTGQFGSPSLNENGVYDLRDDSVQPFIVINSCDRNEEPRRGWCSTLVWFRPTTL